MIERSILEGQKRAKPGSKQEIQVNALRAVLDAVKADGFQDIPLSELSKSTETEKPQEYRPFTDAERKALIKDGAFFISLTGETIEGQQTAGRLFRYVTDGGDRLLKLPSIRTEVAIYPDPKKFFVPNSGGRDLSTQEEFAKKDGQALRKRLGLKDDSVDVIIPDQASTLTELTFKYLDETTKKGKGVWLFGRDYDYLYGRTKNAVNESGSLVAGVGGAYPVDGVDVSDWSRGDGGGGVRVVRLVVAKKE